MVLNFFICSPNREKRGWMGDGAVSANQCVTNFNALTIYRSWTRSMTDNQLINAAANPDAAGIVDVIVPACGTPPSSGDAAWSFAIAEITYQLYRQYGTADIVTDMYLPMKRYFQFLVNRTDPTVGIMISQGVYGDWDAAFNRTMYVANTKEICGTSSYMFMAQYLIQLCVAAGYPEDAAYYTNILSVSVDKYNSYYGNNLTLQNGAYGDGIEQTPTILPLALDFVNATYYTLVSNWLINDVESRGNHLTTGSTGTRHFFEVLTRLGRLDLAAVVAAQDTFPSHGYWVTQGATTAWENWSGVADAQHPPNPTHNHIFLGSHSGWMYENLLGIKQTPDSYGYKHILLQPPVLDTLPSMSGSMHIRQGMIFFAWSWVNNQSGTSMIRMNITIPDNSWGTVLIPILGLLNPTVTEGYSGMNIYQNAQFTYINGITNGSIVTLQNNKFVSLDLYGGAYSFATNHGNNYYNNGGVMKNYQIAQCQRYEVGKVTEDTVILNISCKNDYYSTGGGENDVFEGYNRTVDGDSLRIDSVLRGTLVVTKKRRKNQEELEKGEMDHASLQKKFLSNKKVHPSTNVYQHRYLFTSIVERLCLGKKRSPPGQCIVTYQDLVKESYPVDLWSGVVEDDGPRDVSVCVKMTCSDRWGNN